MSLSRGSVPSDDVPVTVQLVPPILAFAAGAVMVEVGAVLSTVTVMPEPAVSGLPALSVERVLSV